MKPKLYVILGSHACRSGILLMEHKGIDYELVTVPTVMHPLFLRLAGFSGKRKSFRKVGDRPTLASRIGDQMGTVPSLTIDGEYVRTNREIARALDRIQPDPPLFPADPEQRAAVEEAERWGDEVFQMVARRTTIAAGADDLARLVNHGDDGRLGTLLWHRRRAREIGGRFVRYFFNAGERAEQRLLAELPAQLDRIDAWIEDGVLNGEQLNAADCMIAPSLALLAYRLDLRDEIARRPSGRLIDRVLPEPGAAVSTSQAPGLKSRAIA
jgi:glutathione S-transferase